MFYLLPSMGKILAMPRVHEVCGLLVFVNMPFGLNSKQQEVFFTPEIIIE